MMLWELGVILFIIGLGLGVYLLLTGGVFTRGQ
jgi:hypothetical protein